MSASTWSDEMVARLIPLWAAGRSAADISVLINDQFGSSVSRNSVIGKVMRLQLRRPEQTKTTAKNKGSFRLPPSMNPVGHTPNKARARRVQSIRESETARNKTGKRASYLPSLEKAQAVGGCVFPVGEVHEPDFHFCCEPVVSRKNYFGEIEKQPYCLHHLNRCRTAPLPLSELRQADLVKWVHRSFDKTKQRAA